MKKKTWQELQTDQCPKCKTVLMKDMFSGESLGCQGCGFVITKESKDILTNRDRHDK